MLFNIPSILLVLVISVRADVDYEDEEAFEEYGYDGYDEEEGTSTTSSYEDSTVNRVRRYGGPPIKTLSPEDVREVRGALKQLFSGITLENPFTPYTTSTQTEYFHTLSSTVSSVGSTYGTTATVNTTATTGTSSMSSTYSSTDTMTPSYLTDLMTEILKFSYIEPTLNMFLRQEKTTTTANRTNTTNVTTTLRPTTTTMRNPNLDIPRLLAIISDLASEFETNLTQKLHKALMNMTIPTCTTPTPLPPVTSEYDANYTGSVIAKCFVCGLTIPAIPQHAHCADAFAGDFLPLVPVDPTAKGKISRFKKYCQYSNIPGFSFNETQPRIIHGRWTGGCAVRWIDLSGVYTQRTCRNRMHPTMGQHFASKRMAKLERALWNIENGCIISPMATLVPLSRGISLYARFHACVCTGSWCNAAVDNRQWITNVILLTVIHLQIVNGKGD